jgi:hypothetical protein
MSDFSASVFASDAMGTSLDPKDYQYPELSAANFAALAKEVHLHGFPGRATTNAAGLGAGPQFVPHEAKYSNALNSRGELRREAHEALFVRASPPPLPPPPLATRQGSPTFPPSLQEQAPLPSDGNRL